MKKFAVRRDVAAPNRICLVVDVLRRMLRTQDQFFDIGMAKMEYARFAMIDPNDGMYVVSTDCGCPLLAVC